MYKAMYDVVPVRPWKPFQKTSTFSTDNPVLPYSLQPVESYLRNLGNKTANSHIVQLIVEARHTVGLFHR